MHLKGQLYESKCSEGEKRKRMITRIRIVICLEQIKCSLCRFFLLYPFNHEIIVINMMVCVSKSLYVFSLSPDDHHLIK